MSNARFGAKLAKRMRILILTQWFDPEPTLKGLAFANSLVARGHMVHVITGFPNYPGGKLYPGFKIKLLERELRGNLVIWRVPLVTSHSHSRFGRAANYLSFMITAFVAAMFATKPQVIYAYNPPLTVGLTAVLVSRLRRVPVLCDVQDLWPDTLRATSMVVNTWVLRIVDIISVRVYRAMSRISVLSDGFRHILIARGIADTRLLYIPNWAPPELEGCPAPRLRNNARPLLALFAGTMGKAQALESVILAVDLVNQDGALVELALVGSGIEKESLKLFVDRQAIPRVRFLPPVKLSDMPPLLAAADILIVHLADDPLFAITVPSKTQAYLAAGRPIVMAVRGDAARMIENAEAGICADPCNPTSIADALRRLALASSAERDRMGRNGRAFYDEYLHSSVGAKRFGEALEDLAACG